MTTLRGDCPECGGDPTDDSATMVKMGNLGYIPADQRYECAECGTEWQ